MFPSIYSGKPIYAKDLQDLMSEIKSARITSVVGGSFTRGIHGTCITIKQSNAAAGGGAGSEKLPFQVFESPDPEDPAPTRPLFEVNPVSYIWKGIGNIERAIVTPFNTPGQYARFNLPDAPGAIVVTITFDERMGITDAILEQIPLDEWPEGAGGPAGYPWPIERDEEATGANYLRQKKLYIVLAEVSTPEDGREGTVVNDGGTQKKIIQMVKSHLMLDWQLLDGLATKVAIPWADQPQLTN
ncbi:MAG: hypothetical protein ACO265_04690 [Polynucleobacter sp.]